MWRARLQFSRIAGYPTYEPPTDPEQQPAGALTHSEEIRASVAFRVGNGVSLNATVRTTPAGLVSAGAMVAAIVLSVTALVRAIRRPAWFAWPSRWPLFSGSRIDTGLPGPCQTCRISFRSRVSITFRSSSCLADSTSRILAATIASGSPEHAKRPKPCSQQNRRSARLQFRAPRQPSNRRANRGCWESCRRRRSASRTSKPRSDPNSRRRARSRDRNLSASAPG